MSAEKRCFLDPQSEARRVLKDAESDNNVFQESSNICA